jgi:hypothetical protein
LNHWNPWESGNVAPILAARIFSPPGQQEGLSPSRGEGCDSEGSETDPCLQGHERTVANAHPVLVPILVIPALEVEPVKGISP